VQGLGLAVDGMTYHAGGHLGVGGDIGEVSFSSILDSRSL